MHSVKKIVSTLIFILLFCRVAACGIPCDAELIFSPRSGCEKSIVEAIDSAELDIQVAAYSFSSKPIAAALYRAVKRGVIVRMLMDRRQETAHYSMVNDLLLNGLIVRIDKIETMMHMKTMCIDSQLTILGSYNFTQSAEKRNAEILCFIESREFAAAVSKNWFKHWQHAKKSEPKKRIKPAKPKQLKKSSCIGDHCPLVPTTTRNPFRFRRKGRW
jgi:phosphatidylserine/phosphatidylglycerophosphate/cardiolipin synthase-like enzyme